MAQTLLNKAADIESKGSTEAFVVARETLEGKLPTPISGSDGGPLEIAITHTFIGTRSE